MHTVFILRSIFCLNEYHTSISCNNIINLINLIKTQLINNKKITLHIIGWCPKDEYKNRIIESINICNITKYCENFILDLWNNNYGKSKIFQHIINQVQINNYDRILYTDHDILFSHEYDNNIFDILEKYLDTSNYVINNKKIGLIAFNHKEDNRHQMDIYVNRLENLLYSESNNFTSIATGAFYSISSIFNNNNIFYNENKVISNIKLTYGFDDYKLLKMVNENGYYFVVIDDIYIIHPYHQQSDIFCHNCNKYHDFALWKKEQLKCLMKK